MRVLSTIWQVSKHQLRFFLTVLLGYLIQVCIMPYLRVGSVTPSFLFSMIAIVTVGYGKLRALWVGAIYGILMEIMLPSLPLLNLVLYPLSAVFCSIFFADKTEKRLEYERSIGKPGRNINAYLRTLLCAATNILIYEIVNVVYIYLGGTTLDWSHISKALADIVLTVLTTGVIMLPIRRFLGFKRIRQEKAPVKRYS